MAEWEAFSVLEPFESQKNDVRLAFILSTMTNLVIGALGKKGAKMSEVKDFIIEWDGTKPKPVQSIDEMREILMGIVKSSKNK